MSSDEEDIDSIDEDDDEEEDEVVAKPKRRAKKKKAKKDPNRPKRNMSAFFLYSNANRERIKEENPEAKFGEIVSLLAVLYVRRYCFWIGVWRASCLALLSCFHLYDTRGLSAVCCVGVGKGHDGSIPTRLGTNGGDILTLRRLPCGRRQRRITSHCHG